MKYPGQLQAGRQAIIMNAMTQDYKAGLSPAIFGIRPNRLRWWVQLVALGILWLVSMPALGAVIVFDRLTAADQPVFLKVQTRGFFFAEGGGRVTLSINGGQTYRLLTGGDGFGYVKYLPSGPGRFNISAESTGTDSHAVLLVVSSDDRIILLDFEMLLKRLLQRPDEKRMAREVLAALPPDCHLVYVVRYLGTEMARRWLLAQEYPRAVILDGTLPDIYAQLTNKNIQIRAVIGTSGAIDGRIDDGVLKLTFDASEKGTTVENWNQIRKDLMEKK